MAGSIPADLGSAALGYRALGGPGAAQAVTGIHKTKHVVIIFEPNASWSLPSHLCLVSVWSARCSKEGDPMSCANALQAEAGTPPQAHRQMHAPHSGGIGKLKLTPALLAALQQSLPNNYFLGGRRLDPKTDGRPNSRHDVRENVATLGNLVNDFDFTQQPRPPMLLPTNPNTDLT